MLFYRRFQRASQILTFGSKQSTVSQRSTTNLLPVIGVFHTAGFIGIGIYVYTVASTLGGLNKLLQLLQGQGNSYLIREENTLRDYPGLELTYLGWLAIWLTIISRSQRGISWVWVFVSLVQFAGNLLFVDRTRPSWIIFVGAMLLILYSNRSPAQLVRNVFVQALCLLGLFVAISIWSGKRVYGNPYGETPLPNWAVGVYLYGTGGFAYFDKLLRTETPDLGFPTRVVTPFVKVTSLLRLSPPPPNEVLEFLSVPFRTNVGTFLEPFYQDGGLLYVFMGVVIYSFGFNWWGIILLKTRSSFGKVLWANLCFTAAIGFFVPKVGATALWLVVLLTVGSLLMFSRRPASVDTISMDYGSIPKRA